MEASKARVSKHCCVQLPMDKDQSHDSAREAFDPCAPTRRAQGLPARPFLSHVRRTLVRRSVDHESRARALAMIFGLT